MPALTPKVFSLSLDRDANTRPKVLRHFQATPGIWRLSLGTGVTFDEATRVAVELNTKSDGTGEVLAAAETTAGLDDEAASIDVQMTAAQWNQSIPSGKTERILWAVAFIEYPDDRLEVHTVAKVTLVRHSASQTTPAPPEPAVYLSQAALDAAVAALEAEIAALSSVHNDLTSRDAANAHPMSAITGLSDALSGKAASSHTHAQSDVTNLVTDLAGKAASSHTHGMGDVTGLSAALALLAPLASPQLTGRARITDTNNAGLEFWKTTHSGADKNWEIVAGYEEAGELELWAGLPGTNNDPRGGSRAARFGVAANSGGPHFTGAVSVGDVAGTRTNLGLGVANTPTFSKITLGLQPGSFPNPQLSFGAVGVVFADTYGLYFGTTDKQIAGMSWGGAAYEFRVGSADRLGFGSFTNPTDAAADAFFTRAGAAAIRMGGPDAAAPVAQTLCAQGVAAGTPDTPGPAFYFKAPASTGNQYGGSFIFQTSPQAGSGSGQNAQTSIFEIGARKVFLLRGELQIDAADSGAAGLYVKNIGINNLNYGIYCEGGSTSSDYAFRFAAKGGSQLLQLRGDGLLQFFGTTTSQPALKRSSATLQGRLADDSDFCAVQGKLTAHANAATETITPDKTLTLYDAAGTAYKVPCAAA